VVALAFDRDVVRRQVVLLEDAGDSLRSVHLEVPDTGTVCDRTEDGLRLVEHRSAALADRADALASTLRALSQFFPEVDAGVSRRLSGGGS
jgi:hypothetical protein